MNKHGRMGTKMSRCLFQIFALLCTLAASSAPAASLYFVHTDHLGTPQKITDSGQQVVWEGSLTPFGETEVVVNQIDFYVRFPGQYFDGEAGLHYNYFRDYDPSLGRYVQSDPIGLGGGLNTYAYTNSNPIMHIDPLGLEWVYSQSSGQLTQVVNGQTQQGQGGTGYAGNGTGLNNSAAQNQSNVGPLPQGTYTIGQQTNSQNTGPGILPLIPDPNNTMYGRDSFQIHGDNNAMNNTASNGCIVINRNLRNQIANSGDDTLRVVP